MSSDGRIGQLVFVVSSSQQLSRIRTQMVSIIRETWSNPMAHGARIVSTILQNPALHAEWFVVIFVLTVRNLACLLSLNRQMCPSVTN